MVLALPSRIDLDFSLGKIESARMLISFEVMEVLVVGKIGTRNEGKPTV